MFTLATIRLAGIAEFFRAENESWQFSDNVDWVRGRHTLSAGFNYFRKSEIDWDVARNVQFGTGCNGYSGTCTNAFSGSGGDLGYQGGDAMADLVIGSSRRSVGSLHHQWWKRHVAELQHFVSLLGFLCQRQVPPQPQTDDFGRPALGFEHPGLYA